MVVNYILVLLALHKPLKLICDIIAVLICNGQAIGDAFHDSDRILLARFIGQHNRCRAVRFRSADVLIDLLAVFRPLAQAVGGVLDGLILGNVILHTV